MTQPRRSLWPIVAGLVLLPVLYFGAIGPIVWLADREYLPEPLYDAAVVIYWPIDGIRGLPREWLDAYVELWR